MARAACELVAQLGRDPMPEEIAEKAGTSLEDTRETMVLMQEISLDTPLSEQDHKLQTSIQSEASMSLNDLLRSIDLTEGAKEALFLLETRDEQILRLRFGIGEPRDHTLEEITNRFGLSRERIRQIQNRALKKLKGHPRTKTIRDIL